MRLFRKKPCPLCGGKTGWITFRLAEGEKICTSCEKLLRGRYNLARNGAAFRDMLNDLRFAQAKEIIDEMKTVQREDTARFGASCSGVMTVLETFSVPGAGLDEGGAEIAALGGRPAALCFCEFGSFRQGERIQILGRNGEINATIRKLIPCTGAYPFEEELIAGAHKTHCEENSNAWLVFDLENGDFQANDKIVKRKPGTGT